MRFTIRELLLLTVPAVACFAIGRFTAPTDKVTNNAKGLIGIIATQQDEIAVLKQIVETYKAAYGEPDKTL